MYIAEIALCRGQKCNIYNINKKKGEPLAKSFKVANRTAKKNYFPHFKRHIFLLLHFMQKKFIIIRWIIKRKKIRRLQKSAINRYMFTYLYKSAEREREP